MPLPIRAWGVLVNVKLLLDENISPRVADALRADGVDACGVRDRGLLEAMDHEVLEWAFGDDRIVVTKNVGDFDDAAAPRRVSPALHPAPRPALGLWAGMNAPNLPVLALPLP